MGRGVAGSPSNTVWPWPRPTCVPSFILIRLTVWPHGPQYTNVTNRQDRLDRQRSDSVGRTVFGRPFIKRFALCYQTVVCLSCLSVMLVYCEQTVGWIKTKLGMRVGLGPGHIVIDGDSAPLPRKGAEPPNFWPMSIVAKRLNGSRWHLARRWASVQATLCYVETQLPLPERGGAPPPQFSAHICCGQMAGRIKMPLGMEVGHLG